MNGRELLGAPQVLQVIAPKAGLRFEVEVLRHLVLHVGFFAVNVSGQPDARSQVQAPAVEMQIKRRAGVWRIRAIEADNVELLVFHPHASQEATLAGVFLGLHIDHQAPNFAEEFPAHKRQVVVPLLEVVIQHHHLREAQRQKVHGVHAGQIVQHSPPESRWLDESSVIGAIAHIEPAQKVVVVRRGRPKFLIRLHVLDIGFDQRVRVLHLGDKKVLALHNPIYHLVK